VRPPVAVVVGDGVVGDGEQPRRYRPAAKGGQAVQSLDEDGAGQVFGLLRAVDAAQAVGINAREVPFVQRGEVRRVPAGRRQEGRVIGLAGGMIPDGRPFAHPAVLTVHGHDHIH